MLVGVDMVDGLEEKKSSAYKCVMVWRLAIYDRILIVRLSYWENY